MARLPLSLGLILRPAATVRQTDHLRLISSWLSHLFSLALAAGLWLILSRPNAATSLLLTLNQSSRQILAQLGIQPHQPILQIIIAIAAHLLAIEAAFIVAAWGLMAFAATPEPEIVSFTRTLKNLWRLTPHLVVCLILLTLWWQALPLDRLDSFNSNDWLTATLAAASLIFTFAWPVTVILLATRPPTWHAQCRWPAHCQGCGYPLLGLPHHQPCPECGKPIADSLDRIGNAPQSNLNEMSYLRLAVFALGTPSSLGRQLRLLAPSAEPLRLLARTLSLLFMIALGVWLLSILTAHRLIPNWVFTLSPATPLPYLGALVASLITVTLALAFTLAMASTLGSILTVHHRRPLLRAGLLAACYYSPALIPWFILNWLLVSTLLVLANSQWLGSSYMTLSLPDWMLLGVNAACLAAYLIPTARLAATLRYANH